MLGLSLGKLRFLAVIIAAVWYGFKYMNRVEAVRRSMREAMRKTAERQRSQQRSRTLEAEDLVKCTACGAYVAACGATHCGRADCPWGR
jgi:succinate dehydrogenase/fumarate reductase-like Fe-S protein